MSVETSADSPVSVERFARVFVKSAEELPSNADTYFDGDRGYYFKLHLDSVTAEEATPLISKARERFDVELVHRVTQNGLFKERVYVEDPSEVPDDKKVHRGPAGGIYYETGVQQVGAIEGSDTRNVAVIHWDDVELGDDIVFETPGGKEFFVEIVYIEERSEEADIIHVDVDGETYRATPGTYTTNGTSEKSFSTPIRMVKAGDWVRYQGPRGGEGWRHVSTGEVIYQDEPPGESEGSDSPYGDDFDPHEPPEDGYAYGWTGPPDSRDDLVQGQDIEFFEDGSFHYGELIETGDALRVDPDDGEERTIDFSQITAMEEVDGEVEVYFEEADPEEFVDSVDQYLEENPEMGAFLSEHSAEEMAEHELILTPDGNAGAAVSPEGDIQNVFAMDDAPHRAGEMAFVEAVESGGRTLDCYDTILPTLYANHGFVETGRMEFNPEFAPEGWNEDKFGQPDVVFMAYDPEESSRVGHEISNNYYDGTEWGDAKEDSRGRAVAGGDEREKGRGVCRGERRSDPRRRETDESDLKSEGSVTSDTGGVHSARYSPEDEDEEDVESALPPRAEKARIFDLDKQDDVWTYYYGPKGGEGWINMATGEIRYQKQRPGQAPEDGDGYDDWLEDGWTDPPGSFEDLEYGQKVEVEMDGEYFEGEIDLVGDDLTVTASELPGPTDEEILAELGGRITAVEDDYETFDWSDSEFDSEAEFLDNITEDPEKAPEWARELGINPGDTVTVSTSEWGDIDVPVMGYWEGDGDPDVSVYYRDVPPQVFEDMYGDPPFTAQTPTIGVGSPDAVEAINGEPVDDDSTEPGDSEEPDEDDPPDDTERYEQGEEAETGNDLSTVEGYEQPDDFEPGMEVSVDLPEGAPADVAPARVVDTSTSEYADHANSVEVEFLNEEDFDVPTYEVHMGSDSSQIVDVLDESGSEDGSGESEAEEEATTPDEDETESAVAQPAQETSERESTVTGATADYDMSGYDESDVEKWGSLSDFGFPGGVTAHAMSVGALPHYDDLNESPENNAGLVFKTEYGVGGAEEGLGNRQMVTHDIGQALGARMPEHTGNPGEDGYVVAEGVNGRMAQDASGDDVDREDFMEQAALQVILGNNDAHSQNMLVSPDGDVWAIDIDHSAGDMTSDFVGEKTWYDSNVDRATGELQGTASSLGLDVSQQDIIDKAEEVAQQWASKHGVEDEDVAQAIEEAKHEYDYDLAENVRNNLRNFASGEVSL